MYRSNSGKTIQLYIRKLYITLISMRIVLLKYKMGIHPVIPKATCLFPMKFLIVITFLEFFPGLSVVDFCILGIIKNIIYNTTVTDKKDYSKDSI